MVYCKGRDHQQVPVRHFPTARFSKLSQRTIVPYTQKCPKLVFVYTKVQTKRRYKPEVPRGPGWIEWTSNISGWSVGGAEQQHKIDRCSNDMHGITYCSVGYRMRTEVDTIPINKRKKIMGVRFRYFMHRSFRSVPAGKNETKSPKNGRKK